MHEKIYIILDIYYLFHPGLSIATVFMILETLTLFLTIPIGDPLENHPAVPVEDVCWLRDFMGVGEEKIEFAKAIHILRRKLFPFMHNPHPWVEGMTNLRFPYTFYLRQRSVLIFMLAYEQEQLRRKRCFVTSFVYYIAVFI